MRDRKREGEGHREGKGDGERVKIVKVDENPVYLKTE